MFSRFAECLIAQIQIQIRIRITGTGRVKKIKPDLSLRKPKLITDEILENKKRISGNTNING
jgi:hypothetical protein